MNKKPQVWTRREQADLIKRASREATKTSLMCFCLAMIDEEFTGEDIKRVYNRMERYVSHLAEGRITQKETERILNEHGIEVTL